MYKPVFDILGIFDIDYTVYQMPPPEKKTKRKKKHHSHSKSEREVQKGKRS